jgi:4'-phosphopantetheinyl transferase
MARRSELEPWPPSEESNGVLPPNEVHVWHTDLIIPKNGAVALLQVLAPDERDRASQFELESLRNEFIITRAFLRLALARYTNTKASELEFRTTANGKPELAKESSVRFNLSHSAGVAVLAIARDRRVGVDVERIRNDVDAIDIAERFFSRQETDWLRGQSRLELIPAFFSCWTAKEAYVKALGKGLSLPLSGFGIVPRSGAPRLRVEIYDNPEESRRWSMWQLDLGPGLRGALAVEGEDCRLRLRKWLSEGQTVNHG